MAGVGPSPGVECIWDAGALLGEGPVWDDRHSALCWVDIDAPAIHRCDPRGGGRRTWRVPSEIGCLVPSQGERWVGGFKDGLAWVELPADLDAARVTPIADPEPDRPGNRFNDGKCDRAGRLWAGTMDQAIAEPTGVLYRLDPDLSVHRMDEGYVVTNGQAFSPDGRTFYHNDSMAGLVYAFDCDPATGAIRNKREFLRLPGADGVPDGMTVDAAGDLWLAHWGGWRVSRVSPQGRVREVVRLPVGQVTSCAFGGPDLDVLYITSARTGLADDALAEQPLAGGLFSVRVDAAGIPPARFGG